MALVVVTGAGKGIGRAVAERFRDAGWNVAAITRSSSDTADLQALGDACRAWQADVVDQEALARVAAALDGESIDLLVNNAGGFAYGGFCEISAETLEEQWRANVLTAFNVTRSFLPKLRRPGGRIANVVSIAALKPLPGKAAYCAAKAAEAALFRCLRDEVSHEGISVTNIYPGMTFTASFDGEAVDPGAMMSATDVAGALFHACTAGGNIDLEEIVMQPRVGMRL